MARVVYHDAEISLLDDPLAAVDANVGRHLFEKCIIDALLLGKGRPPKKRMVVLVTNALQYLKHPLVNRIVVLKDGTVAETGTYKELTSDENSSFARVFASFNESMSDYDSNDTVEAVGTGYSIDLAALRQQSEKKLVVVETETGVIKQASRSDEMQDRATGAVTRQVYMAWAKAGGGTPVVIFILMVYAIFEGISDIE